MGLEIGTQEMSFTMDPRGLNGVSINSGMAYWNTDTIEKARASARERVNGDCCGQQVGSVHIFGQMMVLGYNGWSAVKGGQMITETIIRTSPVDYTRTPRDRGARCYETTVLDRYEIVHERRMDGTCQCGDPTRQPA